MSERNNLVIKRLKISNANRFADIEINFERPITALVGRTGSGKTTLLQIINALMKKEISTFLNFLRSRYFISDPSVEYYLNPTYFAISDFPADSIGILIKNQSAQFVESMRVQQRYNIDEILGIIQTKMKILFIDEEYRYKSGVDLRLSIGEQILSGFLILTADLRDHLLLIDDIFVRSDTFNAQILQRLIELSKNNQIILVCQESSSLIDELLGNKEVSVFKLLPSPMETRLIQLVSSNTEFARTFKASIKRIQRLLAVNLKDNTMKQAQNMMLFGNIITTLETYLSDAFINTVVNDDLLIQRLAKTDPNLLEWRFTLVDLLKRDHQAHQKVAEYLLGLMWHNLRRVNEMYIDVLEVKFPDFHEISDAILVRHDIIHRSGKKKGQDEKWIISDNIVSETIDLVNTFVTSIDEQLKKKPWQVNGVEDFPVGSLNNP